MAEESISAALRESVRAANALGSSDLAFHRSLDPGFSTQLDSCLKRLLGITSSLLNYVSEDEFPSLEDKEDLDTRWGDIIDVVDAVLEQTDASLEEMTTKAKKEREEAMINKQASKAEKPPLPASLRNAQDLPHPQLKFKRKPDNTDDAWRPLLTEKVNAILPLAESLTRMREVDGLKRQGHPYAFEIENITYPDHVLQAHEPIMYNDIDTTKVTWVDTTAKLAAMLIELRNSQEIAVDLEHHDFHSFRGFVCLMQVSNRAQDWIVDTLALRDELVVLNEVFTDPAIVKVFHGANSDIVWLQRDFGLYIVNLFDTYHASKVLGLQGHGLAFLLNKYVNFDADKRYQLADWRIRPLPREMLYYARSDTHYLLYVYDIMRNELLEKSDEGTHNVLLSVLKASANVSLKQYTKEPYDAAGGQGTDGWQFLLDKFYGTRAFGPQQLEVMKALHQWRDLKAREIDESTRFVMPNQAIVSVAAAMPKDLSALQGATKQMSSTMQANSKTILELIQLAIKRSEMLATPKEPKTDAIETVKTTRTAFVPGASEPAAPVDPQQLVLRHSLFWGALAGKVRVVRSESPLKDLRLSLPLPPLADDTYAPNSAAVVPAVNADIVKVEAAPTEQMDEIFVVKDVSRQQAAKRKSEVIDLDTTTADSEAAQERRESRKKAKQAKKLAREEAMTGKQEGATETSGPVQAFDYAAQPSLLQEKEFKKAKAKKFGEFSGKIVRSKQVQGGKQTTFKR